MRGASHWVAGLRTEALIGGFLPLDRWFTPGRFALGLALLIGASFSEVLFGGRSFFYRDFGVLAYPTVHYWHECFWRGELPLWNPLSYCGVPFLAQWGTMVCYPGSLIFLLFPLPWSLNVFCLAHMFLAGLGMYWLARRWTGSDLGAALAGTAFTFNGVTLSCLLWPNYMVALGWMPLVVLWTEEAWRRGGRFLPLASLAFALQLLAGVPEIAALTWLVVVTRALTFGLGTEVGLGRRGLRLMGCGAIAVGLTAVQILPFIDLLVHSQRDASFATAKWAMPVWGWANLLVPLFHCFPTTLGVFFQHGQEFFSSTYLGLGVATLAVWGTLRVRGQTWAIGALAVLGIALAQGEQGIVYRLFRALVPVAGLARYPVKCLLLPSFLTPLLAAWGVAAWVQSSRESQRPAGTGLLVCVAGMGLVVAGVVFWDYSEVLPMTRWQTTGMNAMARGAFLVLGIGCLIWLRRRPTTPAGAIAGAVLCASVWLDFQWHVPRQNPTLPSGELAAGALPTLPQVQAGEGRIFITARAEDLLVHSRVADAGQDFLGKRLALWSNLNLLDGVPKVNGALTLQIREQSQMQTILYADQPGNLTNLLDYVGARFESSPLNPVEWVARPGAMRMITAGQRPVFVQPNNLSNELVKATFDPRREVLLTLEPRGAVLTTNSASAEVREERYGPHQIKFDVQSSGPAWVVLAQSFYHPWQARVNGEATSLWHANLGFQALEVPSGASHVELVYRDWWFRAGLWVTLGTLLAWLVMLRRAWAGEDGRYSLR